MFQHIVIFNKGVNRYLYFFTSRRSVHLRGHLKPIVDWL